MDFSFPALVFGKCVIKDKIAHFCFNQAWEIGLVGVSWREIDVFNPHAWELVVIIKMNTSTKHRNFRNSWEVTTD